MSHQSPITSHQSLLTALRDGIAQLEREHVPSAPLAAELLLMHSLGRDRAWIYAHPEAELEAATREQYFSLIARRASGVPTQHLTGHQEFWGMDFEVTPDVLIPRPETEHVIEVALERLGVGSEAGSPRRKEEFRIADVGTGSGCIAIALALELPAAQIIATDISAAALEVARRNASRHGVASRITFIECNLVDFLFHESRVTSHESIVDLEHDFLIRLITRAVLLELVLPNCGQDGFLEHTRRVGGQHLRVGDASVQCDAEPHFDPALNVLRLRLRRIYRPDLLHRLHISKHRR